MPERPARTIGGVLAHAQMNNALDVHPLVIEYHAIAVASDRERCPRRSPHPSNCDRVTAKRRIVDEGIVFRGGGQSCGR